MRPGWDSDHGITTRACTWHRLPQRALQVVCQRFTQWSLRPDSGGDGTYRGGLGAIYEIELLEQSAEAFIFGERGKSSPKGIAQGGQALPNVFSYQQGGKWHVPPMISKMVGISLKKGERIRLETPGGGGWGAAAQRDPTARQRDLTLGYTTENQASMAKVKA